MQLQFLMQATLLLLKVLRFLWSDSQVTLFEQVYDRQQQSNLAHLHNLGHAFGMHNLVCLCICL